MKFWNDMTVHQRRDFVKVISVALAGSLAILLVPFLFR